MLQQAQKVSLALGLSGQFRHLPTRELLTILMRQHLELELSSVGTAFWLQAGNSVQSVVPPVPI